MDRILTVTGTGKLSVKPDTTVISISTEETYASYEQTLEKSSEATLILKEAIKSAGLDSKDLKTRSFSIDTAYETIYDDKNNPKRRFIGYSYSQNTSIAFPSNNKQLGKLLYAVANCPLDAEISLRFTLANPEPWKDVLLKNAVEDSRHKAEILASVSDVRLGEIKKIDYSWVDVDFSVRPVTNFAMARTYMDESMSYDIDIEAANIDMTESVTLEWEIL